MRGIGHSDLVALTRLLLGTSKTEWPALTQRVLRHAHAADSYRKRLGQIHPSWGDGSVASFVNAAFCLPPEPCRLTEQYMDAKCAALYGILKWRAAQKRMSATTRRIFNRESICYPE